MPNTEYNTFQVRTSLEVESDCMVSVAFGVYRNQLATVVTFHDGSRYVYYGDPVVIRAFSRLATQNRQDPDQYRLGAFYNQQVRHLATSRL